MWNLDEDANKPSSDPSCDWFATVVHRVGDHKRGTYMFLQFGSFGINKEEASQIVANVLIGLNTARVNGKILAKSVSVSVPS